MDVKSSVAKDIDQRIRELERVVDYTIPSICSSLYLSNEIYGDLSREQEILDRNSIVHPMFIIPTAPVKVAVSG
jgi:prophage DNA circulation protein